MIVFLFSLLNGRSGRKEDSGDALSRHGTQNNCDYILNVTKQIHKMIEEKKIYLLYNRALNQHSISSYKERGIKWE